jgi:hypothetical protein
VGSHLQALEITNAITRVRPFHGGGRNELVKSPKIYGFDTGFVSSARGWDPLRPEDLGTLWEHFVLEHLQAHFLGLTPPEAILLGRDAPGVMNDPIGASSDPRRGVGEEAPCRRHLGRRERPAAAMGELRSRRRQALRELGSRLEW